MTGEFPNQITLNHKNFEWHNVITLSTCVNVGQMGDGF